MLSHVESCGVMSSHVEKVLKKNPLVIQALFPINLLLVLTTGGQLFTGNSATMAIGIYEKKCTTKDRVCRKMKVAGGYMSLVRYCLEGF